MKYLVTTILLLTATCAVASQGPRKPKPQTTTSEQRLQRTEQQMAKMAASHDKTMAKMRQVEEQLDKLIAAVKAFREKVKG